jgi:CBS domain-containing protein
VRVRDIMTTKVFTIRPDKHLRAVEEIMKWAHVRHIPVVDDHGRLVGIVSHRDLMGAAISTLQIRIAEVERMQHNAAIEVRQLMHAPTATIGPDERVQRAAHLMRSLRIGCLPVLEDQHLVGIVTEADLLHIVEELPDAALAPRGSRGPDRLNFTPQST